MNKSNTTGSSSAQNFKPSSSIRHSTPILSRRSSTRTNSRTVTSSAGGSVSQGCVSKTHNSRRANRTSKLKQSTGKVKDVACHSNNDTADEMESDGAIYNVVQQHDNNEQHNLLNLSNASADTVIDLTSNKNKNIEKKPVEYFTFINETGKYKCSICSQEYKAMQYSDTNLRSHLGFKHAMHQYLFPSQLQQRNSKKFTSTIALLDKQRFDTAAIQCIVDDGHAFGIFRRPGMQKFLEIIIPGYHGPSRKTVRKHLDKLYQQHRTSLRESMKKIPFIALTIDLWLNLRRTHFLTITAHYFDALMEHSSKVICFRRFRGRHLAYRLNSFVIKEIEKLNIQSKIVAVTTDSGSDIKAAMSTKQFGTWYSCDAHNINLMVSSSLCLWKIPKQKKSKKSPSPPTTTSSNHDSDEELNEMRVIDNDEVPDEFIEDDDPIVKKSDENETDTSSNSNTSSEEEEEYLASSQQERQLEEPQQELEKLLSNSEELKIKINLLLKKLRKLISMIHKSSILTSFIRSEIQRKKIDLDTINNSNGQDNVKINELVKDFYVRWNSTYLMLIRVISIQQIINDITYTPQAHIGLKFKQIKKLKSLTNSHLDWELLQGLSNVLAPFSLATLCLSGSKYITLSLSYWVQKNLHTFLSTATTNPLENVLKRLLLNKFILYFESKATPEQRNGKLIAAYLDPNTLVDLSDEEISEAESLIINENKALRGEPQQRITTATQSQLQQQQLTSSSSLPNTKRSFSIMTQFKNACNITSVTDTLTTKPTRTVKPLSLKEEFSMYMSIYKQSTDFETFWNRKQHMLLILTSFVRRYSIIPATSVASESAFSVAGYVQRKQR
ncbi:unnamed protein product, partial [Rotaria sordida]